MKPKVVLVGLGPHAKRIYMSCFNKNDMEPTLIIDLDSKKEYIYNYIEKYRLSAETYFVKEENRDFEELTDYDKTMIIKKINDLSVTHAIIATEPKAHFAYIKFFLKNNIHVLVDKPLTAPTSVSTELIKSQKIEEDYLEIKNLYKKARENNTILEIQCQRRWHKGYRFVHKVASDLVKEYGIPITSIQVSHCDGMWNMPSEFVIRENHPYKYGYGKLFHSGYHFIDLVAWFESINNLIESKKADNIELYAASVRPSDFMTMLNKSDYKKLLNSDRFNQIYKDIDQYKFDEYGEIDIYSILQFKQQNKVISTATINLMQNGFSRRSWDILPEDTYKGNGRVRHEYMNIEIGPLMNIQIHSYQSKEVKDIVKGKNDIGEVEHFNIYIFRNLDLIGGEPMEKYTLSDLYDERDIMLGYNETAREECFRRFINNTVPEDSLSKHHLGIRILSKEYESLCRKYAGQMGYVSFSIDDLQ